MKEFTQWYASKKALNSQKCHKCFDRFFVFLKIEIDFLSHEMSMEIHPPFNKIVMSKCWHTNQLPVVRGEILSVEHHNL